MSSWGSRGVARWILAHRYILVVALAATAWGIAMMSRYGITVDSPSLFYAGDRTLFYLLHPHTPAALDFLGAEPQGGFHHDFTLFPDPHDPLHYPVLPGLICAITDAIFHVRLKWLNAIDGHQLGLVLMHAFGLFWYGVYARRVLGRRAGLLATVMLATFPCALGHSFNNAKDWPCAEYYGVAILCAAAGIIERRGGFLLASGVWLGIALSCKFNAVFAPITVVAWTPAAYLVLYHRRHAVSAQVVGAYLVAPYVAGALFFAAWPWLHHGDVGEWWRNIAEYISFMVNYGIAPPHGWTSYSVRCLVYMTPPLVLAASLLFGLAGPWRSRRDLAVWCLLVLWTAIPLIRIAAPRANFYDSNRHFLEYIPGLCAMAAVGLSRVVQTAGALLIRHRAPARVRTGLAAGAACALVLCLAWPIARYHPYETTYFNAFAGGLGGAEQRAILHSDPPLERGNDTEADFWYSSERDGLARMRRMAGPHDRIGVVGPWPQQSQANWTGSEPLVLAEENQATLLYTAPSGGSRWPRIHALERERPVLLRVERGGGLIYELLGARDGKEHPLASPLTRYEK